MWYLGLNISSVWHGKNASVNQFSTDSDNSLSPIRRQAITLTTAWLLSIGLLGTNFSEILIKVQTFIHENA